MTKTNTRNRIVSILLVLVMLLSLLPTTAFAAGSAETKTTDVTDYGSLETAMSDKTTDVVRLTSDITLRDDFDTKIFIEMSKTCLLYTSPSPRD